jgi:hypothetical protein
MKALFALVLVVTSLAASAQNRDRRDDRIDGRIIFRDGRSTVRISVNERNDVNLRIRMLEEAVRDLQAQVYDLRDAEPRTRVVTTHVCSMTTTFNGSFIGKASTRIEAEAITRQNCTRTRESFCASNSVRCEVIQEEVAF